MFFFFVDYSWFPSLLFLKVLLVWLWMTLFPCDQQYTFGSSFETYFFLLISAFSSNVWVACPMFPVLFCISIASFYVIVLLYLDNILFEAIKWVMKSLSDKYASARLYSAEEKHFCSSSALLACWKPACAAFKLCYSHNLLYSNAKNILKLAHVLSALCFLC